jgi:hypothetical protein
MEDCNPSKKPMEVNLKILKDNEPKVVNELLYPRLVGGLIYLTTTRPNITFAIGMLSRFLNCRRKTHRNATKRVLRYIKGTSQCGIVEEKNNNFMLKGFSNVDWIGDTEEKSTTGYAFILGSGVISWTSKNNIWYCFQQQKHNTKQLVKQCGYIEF